MKKGEVWRDRAWNLWEIKVVDGDGPFPIMAKSSNQQLTGMQLFRADGGFSDSGTQSPFDLVKKVINHKSSTQRDRDEIFDAALAAMNGLIAGRSAAPARAVAEQSIEYAIEFVKEFRARIRIGGK